MHEPLYINTPAANGLVIFIHGFMGSPRQFDGLLDAVTKQGLSAASLLLPGHGATIKEFSKSTKELWGDHVNSELDRLSRGYSDVWLAGHSMGGLLAINAAINNPKNVRGLFLIACPLKIMVFSLGAMKARPVQAFARKGSPVKTAYLTGSGVSFSAGKLLLMLKPLAELKKLMSSTTAALGKVAHPVTAFYSKSDELVSIKSADILKARLNNARLDMSILDKSMHAYFPEPEKQKIEEALLKMVTAR